MEFVHLIYNHLCAWVIYLFICKFEKTPFNENPFILLSWSFRTTPLNHSNLFL